MKKFSIFLVCFVFCCVAQATYDVELLDETVFAVTDQSHPVTESSPFQKAISNRFFAGMDTLVFTTKMDADECWHVTVGQGAVPIALIKVYAYELEAEDLPVIAGQAARLNFCREFNAAHSNATGAPVLIEEHCYAYRATLAANGAESLAGQQKNCFFSIQPYVQGDHPGSVGQRIAAGEGNANASLEHVGRALGYFHNYTLAETAGELRCVTHGDIHVENIILDTVQHRVCFIDFETTVPNERNEPYGDVLDLLDSLAEPTGARRMSYDYQAVDAVISGYVSALQARHAEIFLEKFYHICQHLAAQGSDRFATHSASLALQVCELAKLVQVCLASQPRSYTTVCESAEVLGLGEGKGAERCFFADGIGAQEMDRTQD